MSADSLDQLAGAIARSFVKRNHPDQLETLDEFVRLQHSGLETQTVSPSADKFSPIDFLPEVVGPIVYSIVAAFLYDLLAKRGSGKREVDDPSIDAIAEAIRANPGKIRRIERRLVKQVRDGELVRQVLEHTVRFVEDVGEMPSGSAATGEEEDQRGT